MATSTQTLAKFAAVYSGLVFGIYWIPLRALERAGFEGPWAIALFNVIGLLFIVPLLIRRAPHLLRAHWRMHLCGMLAGLGFVVYAGAFLYTEVIKVIVLFYLMPVWGFLLARWFIGEAITPVRWLSMLLGLVGLGVISGVEHGLPLPSRSGDWMALAAGIMWAGTALLLLVDKSEPVDITLGFLFWGTVFALVLAAVATAQGRVPTPTGIDYPGVLIWLVPFVVVVVVPAAFATIYGPTQLNPGIVGLLFMTEISVGATTAALFAGESFGGKEIAGVLLITLAGIAEPIAMWSKRRAQTPNAKQEDS